MGLYQTGRAVLPREAKTAVKAFLERPLPRAGASLAWEIHLAVLTGRSRKRMHGLVGASGLKLHLGCGKDLRAGWVNIDAAPPASGIPREILFIEHDLRRPIPLPAESCELIYSSHLLEHLEYRHGTALVQECHRLLSPGGRFRAALPNQKLVFDAYLRGDRAYFGLLPDEEVAHVAPGTEALVDWVNYCVYQRGEHRTIYDEEKLLLLLSSAGFRSARASEYDPSQDPDDPVRVGYSFYVEAHK